MIGAQNGPRRRPLATSSTHDGPRGPQAVDIIMARPIVRPHHARRRPPDSFGMMATIPYNITTYTTTNLHSLPEAGLARRGTGGTRTSRLHHTTTAVLPKTNPGGGFGVLLVGASRQWERGSTEREYTFVIIQMRISTRLLVGEERVSMIVPIYHRLVHRRPTHSHSRSGYRSVHYHC